jgi:hypothetical protein
MPEIYRERELLEANAQTKNEIWPKNSLSNAVFDSRGGVYRATTGFYDSFK